MTHDEHRCYVLEITGTLPPGSRHVSHVVEYLQNLETEWEEIAAAVDHFIIDCSRLVYQFGDALASLWLLPIARGISSCAIIAQGETRTALENLVRMSIPVPVVASIEEALTSPRKFF
jgi:hypothetical protein